MTRVVGSCGTFGSCGVSHKRMMAILKPHGKVDSILMPSSQKIPGARLLVPSLGRPGVRIWKIIKSKESLSCQNCRSQPEKAILQTKTKILHTLEDVGIRLRGRCRTMTV